MIPKKGNIYYHTHEGTKLECMEVEKHAHGISTFLDEAGDVQKIFNPYIFDEPYQLMVLHLTLTKEWFDMIACGEKKQEYRDIKLYFGKRFLTPMGCVRLGMQGKIARAEVIKYDIVRFVNGYGGDKPTMDVIWKGLKGGVGKPKWGAEKGKQYFIIGLGKIKSISNHNP